MAQIKFGAKTTHNIVATRSSHIRTNLQQIGAAHQESITVELGIDQDQSGCKVGCPVSEMRYVNIAKELYYSDEKQVISTQIYTAFVADANKSDTESEITINCMHIVIDMFNVSLYNPMLFCVDTGAIFSCIGRNTLQRILRKSNRKDIARRTQTKSSDLETRLSNLWASSS